MIKKFFVIGKGFTLIEMLLVISILGILTAFVIPNLGKYLNTSKNSVKKAELSMMQHTVPAAMAEAGVSVITGDPLTFGNTGHASHSSATDLAIGSNHLAEYIYGGLIQYQGEYQVAGDGTVTLVWYP